MLRDGERFVITSVATSLGTGWRCGENPPDAYLVASVGTIAVEISTLTQRITDGQHSRPRLSDDRAARNFIDAVNGELRNDIPRGSSIELVLSSPILKFHSTKTKLAKAIRRLPADPASLTKDHQVTIDGNDIIIYLNRDGGTHPRKVTGIYPHRDSNPNVLANVRLILEDRIADKSKKCAPIQSTERPLWLALLNDYWLAPVETYRYVMASLTSTHPFDKILLVNRDGSIHELYPMPTTRSGG